MFTLPDDITAATDLSALETAALAEFDTLAAIPPDDLTDEQIGHMETLVSAVRDIQAEGARRTAAAADRAARIEAARQTMSEQTVESPASPDDPADDPAEDPEPNPDPEPAPEPTEPKRRKAEAAVTAAAPPVRRSAVRAASSGPRAPQPRPDSGLSLIAAADIPGVATGSLYDGIADVAKAFSARISAFPKGKAPRNDIHNRYGVAVIKKDFGDLVDTNPDYRDSEALVAAAAKENRLPGGSLVAAGGWCAPSETLYDLCENESLDGLIDLPEIGITRGGIRFTKGPDFSDIYDNIGFVMTEAEAESGDFTKPCYEVPCPEFEEIRLDAVGLCIRAPLLTNAGYPELVQRVIRGALVAQQHKTSAYLINQMVATAGDATATNTVAGIGLDVLGILEWVGESTRYRYRLSFAETLEVVAPHWLLPIIRQDLALRTGRDNPATVSDAEITTLFANRGVRIQWVYDWQPLITASDDPDAPANACMAAVPETVELLVYPAGTFVRGTADVISLDAVYDTASLQQNMYTALFMEEGDLVANRCFDACLIDVPICIAGRVGAALDADTCWTAVAAEVTP